MEFKLTLVQGFLSSNAFERPLKNMWKMPVMLNKAQRDFEKVCTKTNLKACESIWSGPEKATTVGT